MEPGTKPARDEILQLALALDLADRAYLADELERSLPSTAFASGEIATAWSEEIDRRIAAYDRGETTAISFDSALDHIRTALAEHRTAISMGGRFSDRREILVHQ